MYLERGEDVYAGKIDFRDGEWVEKCSPHSPRYWTTPEGLAEIERQR